MFETSATLLLRLKSGGDERELAWAGFCQRYEPIIVGFARRMGVATGEIPDLVQQVLMGFYSAQPRFVYKPELGRFRGYLKTCVLHEIQRIRTINTGRLRREESVARDEHARDTTLDVDELWEKQWEATRLEQAMERVREHYKSTPTFEAFRRTMVLGLDPGEVAAELGISRDSVYQAKTRVLARLKLEVDALAEEAGE